MGIGTILLIFLAVLLAVSLVNGTAWGPYPSGIIGVVLVVLLLLVVLGYV